jgi:predicted TIM-barrel fold metal-dependent hydrolase
MGVRIDPESQGVTIWPTPDRPPREGQGGTGDDSQGLHMIVDTHTQIWTELEQLGPEIADRLRAMQPDWLARNDADPAAHDRAMSCVDAAFVMGFRSRRLEAGIPNELVADFVGRDPNRRIGIAGIDPLDDDAQEQLDAAASMGLVGVVISPALAGFHPTHSAAMRLYEHCMASSMPVFVTLPQPLPADARLEFGHPVLWDEVGRLFPDLPIVFCQSGHPWVSEAFTVIGKHKRMYASLDGVATRPWQLYNTLLEAQQVGIMDRLLLGSGYPHALPERAIECLYSVNSLVQGTPLPTVPRSQVRGIVERDVPAALGLDVAVKVRTAVVSDPISGMETYEGLSSSGSDF